MKIMLGPVPVERGDLICVSVTTNTVWLVKATDIQTNHPVPIPGHLDREKGTAKRHFPTQAIFTGVKTEIAWKMARTLAYAIAWVAGFGVGDDTERYLQTNDTYVFRVW